MSVDTAVFAQRQVARERRFFDGLLASAVHGMAVDERRARVSPRRPPSDSSPRRRSAPALRGGREAALAPCG